MCSPAAQRPERAPQVAAFLRDRPEDSLYISAVTVGGVERGIQRQRRRNRDSARGLRLRLDRTLLVFADRILDFGAEDARIRGRLSAETGCRDNHIFGDCIPNFTAYHIRELTHIF